MTEQMDREYLEKEIKKLSSRVILLRFLQVIVAVNTGFMTMELISQETASGVTITLIAVMVVAFVATAEILLRRFKVRMAKAKEFLAGLGTGQ